MYEGVIQNLIDELGRLPGVGPKGAQRIAFHLLAADQTDVRRLADALIEVTEKVRFCRTCGNVAEADECRICLDPRRDLTYVKDTVLAKSTTNKALFASIMGIEAQHASVLLAVQALLQAGAPQLISLAPGTAAMLPAAAGSVGFPNAFYKTNQAAPASQGAVK